MIKITITSFKVDAYFAEEHTDFTAGNSAYYVIRENGKRLGPYFLKEHLALKHAWALVKEYGLTLVEPW